MPVIDHAARTGPPACATVKPTRPAPDMPDDIRASLLTRPRSLSPKYFYDERGSKLFSRICETPEYYPTRVENGILKDCAAEVIRRARPARILELGSGYSLKTRRLLDACEALDHRCVYAPFDVCEEVLIETTQKLMRQYQWLDLVPLLGDYQAGLGNLPRPGGPHLFVFLGGAIGNFREHEALQFIKELDQVMQTGDHLLIGVDRVKECAVLNAAYNDAAGITAEFNLNVLRVLNRSLNADFEPAAFDHHAAFNTPQSRIEMRLIANTEQEVHIQDLNESIRFEQGDDILTEVSHKYTYSGIENMLSPAGLAITEHYEDEQAYFSLILAAKQG